MGLFKKIFSFLGPPQPAILPLYVKCNHCQTIFMVRVDLERDLENTYEEGGTQYTLKKEAMDSKCFRLINIDMEFDGKRNILQQNIVGGTFVTQEEYQDSHAGR